MAELDEPTQLLIQSNKADVMTVKTRDGDKLGSVYVFMINKRTGETIYSILSIGGFLGIGKAYYPIPFQLLQFEPTSDAYVLTIDRRVLEGGPSWAANPQSSTKRMPTGSRVTTRWLDKICQWVMLLAGRSRHKQDPATALDQRSGQARRLQRLAVSNATPFRLASLWF